MEQKKQCCDPFNKHSKHESFDAVTQVNKELASKARKLKKRITTADMICSSCRKTIHNECIKLDKADTSSAGTSGTSTAGEPPAKKQTAHTRRSIRCCRRTH